MASIVTNLTCELTAPVSVVFLPGNMFSMDNGGNIINVFVVQNGEPVALGGSVSANVIRSDGTTVAITGALEGNKAYIILPQACYAVPGIVHIVMKITEGTTITTIAAITANVYQSSTDAVVDPGQLIPSIAALIEAIEDAVDSIPVDYSGLLATLAADYSTSKTYKVGDYAWYGGVLKRCIVAITTAESYNSAHWTNAVIGDDLSALKSAIDPMIYQVDIMVNKLTNGNNNTAMTNNGDGSVTIGTTDNGNTTFGDLLELTPGDYYLYGVPNGIAFLTTVNTASSSYTNRVFENTESIPKLYHVSSTVSVYVAFRSPSRPGTAYTVYPALYKVEQINRAMPIKTPVCFNGNYFEDAEEAWNDGLYKTASGVIDTSTTYQYAYCPLIGAGNYVLVIQYSVWGSTSHIVALCDEHYHIVKSVEGVRDGNNISFSVSAADIINCKYAVIRRLKANASTFSPKLFYDSTARGGVYPMNPVYGYDTDPLYKKIVVCDGDSICAGYLDNPKGYGAWFGRLQNNYQVTGNNYGVSGATITNMTPTVSHSVTLSIETIHTAYPTLDYLILEGGTNDADRIGNFDGDTPPEGFGTWSDENVSDYNGSYDNTTFCGAVEELFYKAVTYYPNAKIGFIIPMQMGTLMVPSKRRRRYFDEIIKIAKKWHINVLDLWNICHADARVSAYYGTEGDLTKFYYDGQHPTSVGYDLLQPIIEAWMKTL